MNTKSISEPRTKSQSFNLINVSLIASGHFTHDIFTAFVSPLLPEIIRILQISLLQAGTLSAAMQLPGLLNPLIGYLDDKKNLRLMMIIAPGVTATLLGSMGLATNYITLLLILFLSGISSAFLHAIAPARIARHADENVGLGMSIFMAAGELGRTIGPLLAAWAVGVWTIKGIFPLSILGWISSFLLWFRFYRIPPSDVIVEPKPVLFKGALRFFIPATTFILLRGLMVSSLGTYLPTLLTMQGASLISAGGALAAYQLSGSIGALVSGTLSDRIGRRKILAVSMGGASLLLIMLLNLNNSMNFPLLIIIGFLNLTAQPIMLALVQDSFKDNRSMGNGIYMGLTFVAFSITSIIVGAMGDWLGLQATFFWCGLISLLAVPVLLLFPDPPNS